MAAMISGSTLAMLFYDHSSSLGNKEGLLTGKVINQVKDTISDSQINNVQVETKIYIYGCSCQCKFESFHDNKGNIQNISMSVIGWYKYRHNTSHRMSMKEKSVHQSLLRNIPPDRHKDFLFILCTSQKTENVSTCSFDHTVFKFDTSSRKFVAVPLTVINLGDTTHTEYRCTRSCSVDYDSGAIGDLLGSFEHDLLGPGNKSSEATGVQNMAQSLQAQLQCLTHGVMESDLELHRLQSELEEMEASLIKKQEKKRAMKPLPPSPTVDTPSTSKGFKDVNQARLKNEQGKKNPLYPNLSDLKESNPVPRSRRLSEDNYPEKPESTSSTSLHNQMEQKCHLLDSPIEMEENSNPSISLSVGNSLEPSTSSEKLVKKETDNHMDIPFADSEGFDHISHVPSAKNKSDAISKGSSDPFDFVTGIIATSKGDTDGPKRKVNQGKGQGVKGVKGQTNNEGSRVTRSRNNQTDNQTSAKQTGNQNKSRSRSRSREPAKTSNKGQKKLNENSNGARSDEDIFNTNEDSNDGIHVIDVSSSPVF